MVYRDVDFGRRLGFLDLLHLLEMTAENSKKTAFEVELKELPQGRLTKLGYSASTFRFVHHFQKQFGNVKIEDDLVIRITHSPPGHPRFSEHAAFSKGDTYIYVYLVFDSQLPMNLAEELIRAATELLWLLAELMTETVKKME